MKMIGQESHCNSERNGASHRRCGVDLVPAKPAASAVPLTELPPRELDEIDTELKGVTDRIVEMTGELSQ